MSLSVLLGHYHLFQTWYRNPDKTCVDPIGAFQFQPTLVNWQNEFSARWPEISKALTNSLIISLGAAIVAVGLGTFAGYGLAR